ncbi:hypothetical protein C8Q72DRAFT_282154 [Fomitopsis betulina]|nr:hypothetical protein C8Q72DRAFT_282154 [Fomitopsis betulina]
MLEIPPPAPATFSASSSSSSSSSAPPPGDHHRHHHHLLLPHITSLIPHPPQPHLPHFPHHHNSMYSPSSRAADISRLLDPPYASGASSSSSSTRTRASGVHPAYRSTLSFETKHPHPQTRAYVDHRGDLHDPDYRDFPDFPLPTRRTRSHNQRRPGAHHYSRRSRSASRPRYSPSYELTSRPEWEHDWTELDDDSDDEASDSDSRNQHLPLSSASRAFTTHTTTQPHTNYIPYTDYYTVPQPLTFSTSPTGSRESPIHESPLEDSPLAEDASLEAQDTEYSAKTKRRRSSAPGSVLCKRRNTDSKEEDGTGAAGTDASAAPAEGGDEQRAAFTITGEQRNDVPSCSAGLRRQWAALSLRIRFGLYHAKRRFSLRSGQQPVVATA